jgi:hypothetical protein
MGKWKNDDLVKSRNSIELVIPAKAGIQLFEDVLDPGFRRGDALRDFLRDHQYWNNGSKREQNEFVQEKQALFYLSSLFGSFFGPPRTVRK